MKIYKVKEILSKLETCIENDIPFSHIRFGDGGLKYMSAVLRGDVKSLNIILKKEGMPHDRIIEIFELWGYYARQADFIDSAQVYLDGYFWPRVKGNGKNISEGTARKLIGWKDLYNRSEIDNENYCNPESNYLMTIRFRKNTKNLLDLMKDRKVCIITARPGIKETLKTYGYNIDVIQIVRQYEDQYKRSFENVIFQIREYADKYDFWLTAAGELGRIYSGLIKEHGGRTIDIGFIIEFWLGYDLHPRLEPFLMRNPDNYLETILHDKGKMFSRYI
jgi:hypothetical protein